MQFLSSSEQLTRISQCLLDSLSSLYSRHLRRSQFCSVNSFYTSTYKYTYAKKLWEYLWISYKTHALFWLTFTQLAGLSRAPPRTYRSSASWPGPSSDIWHCHFIAPSFEILKSSVHRIMSVNEVQERFIEGPRLSQIYRYILILVLNSL